jgi:hypothetical protein
VLDPSEKVFFHLCGHQSSPLGQEVLHQIVQVDLLQSLVPDQV